MQSEDQYMDRTPDLVAKVRAMREAAEKEMNRFTRAADYDVRRIVGHGPKASPVSVETVPPSPAVERIEKVRRKILDQSDVDRIYACSCGARRGQ
jgi:hypothetical protein